jgi:predicted AAA+ superfamily ATPase
MYLRQAASLLATKLRKPYVHVLFGARQTGKSTLLRALLPRPALWLDLANPGERSRYLIRPETLVQECRALPPTGEPSQVVIDEVQAVPPLFDAVQHLYDSDKNRWRFILCGSSARKLRVTGANLLPGRSLLHHLYPLILQERPAAGELEAPGQVLLPLPELPATEPRFPATTLVERLAYGELPGIALAAQEDRTELLHSYAYVYLEEELRREALIKDWPAFARFLKLAALESGQITNFTAIARDSGISAPAVKSHYQLLEDMFIGFRVDAFYGSTRKHVLSTPRFFFFDLGVRHAAAGLACSADTVLANPGPVFEQWVGIELWKRLQYLGSGRLLYLRSKAGTEVDFIIERSDGELIPIEVKWTESPSPKDGRHLRSFLDEQPRARRGYIICRCSRAQMLDDRIMALPWSSV